MAKVEREFGSVQDSVAGDTTVITVTVEGNHVVSEDLLDRVLQFVLVELDVDTKWKTAVQEVPEQ